MKKLIFLFLFITLFWRHSDAQDFHSSQFYEITVLRNPALVGIFSGDYRASVNYRRQWGSISVPFQTFQSSVESRIKLNNNTDYLSIGVGTLYDKAGSTSYNSLYAYPAINFNKSLEDAHHSYLSVGVTFGYVQRSVNITKMVFGDQFVNGSYDPANMTADSRNDTKYQYWDLGAGVSFNSTLANQTLSYYIAAAAYRINNADGESSNKMIINSLKIPMKIIGSFGMRWAAGENLVAGVDANYTQQGENTTIMAGGTIGFRTINYERRQQFAIHGGVYCRWEDSWIPTLKIDYNRMSFTMSYDVNYSGLKMATGGKGGYEFTICVNGLLDEGVFASDKVECPKYGKYLLTD